MFACTCSYIAGCCLKSPFYILNIYDLFELFIEVSSLHILSVFSFLMAAVYVHVIASVQDYIYVHCSGNRVSVCWGMRDTCTKLY